ncbi:YecA family protein [Arsenophonus apicola]|uniref:YecA/YgfB family protein n=1 Tax=Arsenophonus apicola TaxID=2879119 RepID=UPI003879F563
MPIQKSLPNYQTLELLLQQQNVALTAAEMHGLITGLICGGNHDYNWKKSIYELTNDGLAFSQILTNPLRELYDFTLTSLDNNDFIFNLLLPEDGKVFEQADALAGWVNHFLLGLGVTQPKLMEKKELKELVTDLRNIGMLGYDKNDDQNELEQALEEIIEYVKVAVQLCFIALMEVKVRRMKAKKNKPTLH